MNARLGAPRALTGDAHLGSRSHIDMLDSECLCKLHGLHSKARHEKWQEMSTDRSSSCVHCSSEQGDVIG